MAAHSKQLPEILRLWFTPSRRDGVVTVYAYFADFGSVKASAFRTREIRRIRNRQIKIIIREQFHCRQAVHVIAMVQLKHFSHALLRRAIRPIPEPLLCVV